MGSGIKELLLNSEDISGLLDKPILKPICPNFGSGPTAKFPTWTLENLESALVGRSHRSVEGQEKTESSYHKNSKSSSYSRFI